MVEYEVASAVAVDVTEAEAVALGFFVDCVFREFCGGFSMILGKELINDKRVAGQVRHDFGLAVHIDVPESDSFDVAAFVDVMGCPRDWFSLWVLSPAQGLAPPSAGDYVEVTVAIDVKGVIREVVVPVFFAAEGADFVGGFKVGAGEPVFARYDVEAAVFVNIEDGGGLVCNVSNPCFFEFERFMCFRCGDYNCCQEGVY